MLREQAKEEAAAAAKEGFYSSTTDEDSTTASIGSRNLPLTSYFIKSSYNSCLENQVFSSSLSITQLNKVIAAGYRFLDFEVCQIGDEIRVCSNSTYGDDTNQGSPQTISFTDVLDAVSNKALVAGTSYIPYVSNYKEPLFVHLRLKFTTIVNKTGFFDKIGGIIQTKLSPFMMSGTPTWTNIKLQDVINKGQNCFVLLDITNLSSTDMGLLNNSQLKNFIHGETTVGANANVAGNIFFYEDYANDLEISSTAATSQTTDSASTTSTIFNIVIPKAQYTTENAYPYDYARKYGHQIVTMNAVLNDYGMQKTNGIFTNTGFVSMDVVIKKASKDTRYYIIDDVKYGIFLSFSIFCIVGVIAMTYKSPSSR